MLINTVEQLGEVEIILDITRNIMIIMVQVEIVLIMHPRY